MNEEERTALPHNQARILVVEDSAIQAASLRRLLSAEGYAVTLAGNGVEGLARVRGERPDLVISDILMPEMDGFELCRQIKTDAALREIPVVLLTSLSDPKDVIKGLECGADNFITKPYEEKHLLSRVKYVLLGRELHRGDQTQMGVEILFAGHKYLITSERQQILNLLLSTYESAVQKNLELLSAQEELRGLNDQLEEKVKERTGSLRAEIAERHGVEEKLRHSKLELEVQNAQLRHAQVEIEESRKKYLDLYDFAPVGYFTFAEDGRIVDCNLAGAVLLGEERFDLIERFFVSFVDPASADVLQDHFRLVFADGARKSCEVLLRGKGDPPITVLVESILVKEERGGAPRCRSALTNITERKVAEVALSKQMGRLALLNQIARAVAERQELGSMLRVVLRRLITDFPLEVAAILTYEREGDLLSIHLQDGPSEVLAAKLGLSEGTRISLAETGLQRCVAGETLFIREMARWKGALAPKLAHFGIGSGVAAPMAAEDQIFGILVVFRVETNGFAAEEVDFVRQLCEHVALAMHQARLYEKLQTAYDELRTTQQAIMKQERLRALGLMAAGIAHDINNALSPIVMLPELMLVREENLSGQGRHYLETVRQAAVDIAHTVERMREFYRSRDEQEKLLPVCLNCVVQEVIDLTRPRWLDIPQKSGVGIRVESELESALPDVLGIESELREALTNLILNAVDALPEGGTITFGTGAVKTGEARGEGVAGISRVVLWVRDTGIGMDEDTRLHCMEPFYTKKGTRGTGLGLSMVYGIMQRHHAEIEIESAPGSGTTFRLLFPVPKEAAGKEVSEEPVAYHGPTLKILCIDDEPLLRDGLRDALASGGHAVTCVDSGQAGLQAFRDAGERGEPFQVIVTDLGMPQMDGREVARAVKRESPNTPVILLTGWGTQMKGDGEIPEGVDRIVSKPPKLAELLRVIAEVAAPRR